MSSEDIPKGKMRRIIFFVIILIVVAILVFIVVSLIIGFITGSSPLSALFSQRLPEISVDEFNFSIGRARMFATTDSSIAGAGTLGIKVLNVDGIETLRDSFRMGQPAIASSSEFFIAFDVGGTAVRVFNSTRVTSSVEVNGTVVSASVNQNGWFCIVTQDGSGYRGIVTVYNNMGHDVYRVSIGGGFVLSAELSHDNKNLAILSFTGTGSRISFYHDINTEDEPFYIFDYSGGIILEIAYMSNGDILAFSADLLFIVDGHGNREILYSYHDNRLGGYAYHKDFIALHLYDYGIGHQGRLITLLADGTILGETGVGREIVSMSAIDNSLVVLRNDGVAFFNEELEEFSLSTGNVSAAGASRVLAIRENTALATGDNSAVVLRREEITK